MAVYKGLTVTVYTVNKTEINLTRTDFIELVNVRTLYILFTHFLFIYYSSSSIIRL